MKKTGLFFVFLSYFFCFSQNVLLSGYVIDKNSGENLIGARIYSKTLKKGVLTNNYGYYSISIPKNDTIEVLISYVGHQTIYRKLFLTKNTELNFELNADNILNTVTVIGKQRIENKNEISTLSIPKKQIKSLPSLAGNVDIMRAYQLMPGVQFGKEGTSGIYVRGGSPDQNLFILDDIPLYYVNHLGGFVSVFDINAVNSMTLYKGGFPAKYGGRISSVIDFRMKEGNKNKIKKEINLGVFTTSFFIEGPIKKKSTFFISLRRSNIDLFTRLISYFDNTGSEKFTAGYTFFDFNSKYTYQINKKSKLQFSTYLGQDNFFLKNKVKENAVKYVSKSNIKWGNKMAQLKYINNISSKLFNVSTMGITYFNYNTIKSVVKSNNNGNEILGQSSIEFKSKVFDLILKSDFDYFLNSKNKISFGIEGVNHFFTPGINSSKQIGVSSTSVNPIVNNKLIGQELKLFIQDKIKFTPRFSANLGLHFQTYFIQKAIMPSVQPRVLINYNLTEHTAIRLAYSKMNQNIHLLSNSGTGLPTDLWMPATKNLKPEMSDQFTVGFDYSFGKQFELTIESYYKTLSNLINYKEGATYLNVNGDWEDVIVGNGSGKVKGVEFLIKKNAGKFQGWIAYTWLKNTRQFDELNNGIEFYYKYDRRHDISLVGFYEINKNVSLSATWVFTTGTPITIAQNKNLVLIPSLNWNPQPGDSSFVSNNFDYSHIYNGKNSYRMPNYHKLDIAIKLTKSKPKGIRVWQFGVYNAYNRQNPFFLFYKKVDTKIKLYQVSLFPLIPSLSYTFIFN